MVRVGSTAQRQIDALVEYYLHLERPAAVANLRTAIEQAIERVERGNARSRSFPSVYRELVPLGMSWIKQHVYWFGYGTASDGVTTIANVFHERADIPGRAELLE